MIGNSLEIPHTCSQKSGHVAYFLSIEPRRGSRRSATPLSMSKRTAERNPNGARIKENPPEEAPGGLSSTPQLRSTYALFIAAFTASAVIGSERMRAPEALKIALPSAGAITVTAGSPTPVAFSPLAITLTATSGT